MSDLSFYSDPELEAERDFLLTSLSDLDAELAAGDVDAHDYEALRDGYTARAAAVLRLLDHRRVAAELSLSAARPAGAASAAGAAPAADDAPAAPSGAPSLPYATPAFRRHRWRRLAVAAGVAAFAVGAGFAVAGASGQRLPGETGSGATPDSKMQGELLQAVNYFQAGDVLDAIKTYDKVLATDPANAEALAYKGWLLRLTGVQASNTELIDDGLASILEAERVDPSYPDAHFFGGEIYLRDKDDPKDAITEFETYLADNPPVSMGPEVQGELQAAQAALAGKALVPPTATFTPVSPGTSAAPAGPPAAAASTTTVAP